jgi:hypothetical protein
MLADLDSSTETAMKNTIYIRLLGEGVQVYRPVPASQISSDVFLIEGADFYDPEDEKWEFLPGTRVVVEKRVLEGEAVLVAIAKENN